MWHKVGGFRTEAHWHGRGHILATPPWAQFASARVVRQQIWNWFGILSSIKGPLLLCLIPDGFFVSSWFSRNKAAIICIESMAIISRRFISFNLVSTTSRRLINIDSVTRWNEWNAVQNRVDRLVSIDVALVEIRHVPYTWCPFP